MKITIKEVAQKANVSVATVSRCINNTGYVHEKTKETIQEIIKELGYEPNQLARLLHNRCSMIIGVIIPDTVAPFYSKLIEGIEKEAMQNGYKTMLCVTHNNPDLELEYIKVFEKYLVDGLIICSNFNNVKKVMELDIPIVSIDHILDPQIPSITTDNIEGGKLACEKLIASGANNFVLFRGPSFLITTTERTLGFEQVISNYDYPWDFHDFDLVNPDAAFIENYILNNPQVNGIFTLSDTIGIIVVGILNKIGRKLGEDVFLVSFDGLDISNWVYPAISTIVQPISYMGIEAFDTLLKLLTNKPLAEQHKIIKISYKERDTTK